MPSRVTIIGVFMTLCCATTTPSWAQTYQNIVLWAADSTVRQGGWVVENDATAAGGKRIRHPDAGLAKITPALASPTHYFELTFDADAGVAYHLWVRGRADGNAYANDSMHAQFSDSVDAPGGAPVYRIGTTSSAAYTLEDCVSCGVSGWGWQDNGSPGTAPIMGPHIYFASSGTHTIRIQTREDGLAIDQIVLSATTYLNASPGALKNDTVILNRTQGESSEEVIIFASQITAAFGAWVHVADTTAAAGTKLRHPDAGAAKIVTALANPIDYFEATFTAQAGVPYHFWMRSKADANAYANDSVHVQFSDSVAAPGGAAVYRIGTTNSTVYTLEDCTSCGLSSWGWQDNGFDGM